MKNILYIFDTDPWPSPFDINVAYDVGFDVVVPFGGVKPDKSKSLVEDAMFSRGIDGSKKTKIFINGSSMDEVRELLDKVKKSMVPPFELSIFVDPRGGYTTGASIVAQVENHLDRIGKSSINGLKVVVFGGTGPVGQVIAVLCAQANAEVLLLSRQQQKAEAICESLKKLYNVSIKAGENGDDQQRIKHCEDKDIIFTAGTAGVELISLNVLKGLPKNKILFDANAVPPLGIAGIDVFKKDKEHPQVPGLWYHGALSVGDIKLKVEYEALKQCMNDTEHKIFDFRDFFQIARKIYAEKKAKKSKN